MTLRIATFEGKGRIPVIEHTFHGSRDQIMAIVAAHRKTDSFFRAATATWTHNMTYGTFRGIELTSTWHWSGT